MEQAVTYAAWAVFIYITAGAALAVLAGLAWLLVLWICRKDFK